MLIENNTKDSKKLFDKWIKSLDNLPDWFYYCERNDIEESFMKFSEFVINLKKEGL